MTLPSRVGGPTTRTVGFFEHDHRHFAEWHLAGLSIHAPGWHLVNPRWTSIEDALHALKPMPILSREACIDLGGWTLLLNNTPLGTDPGILPIRAANELACRAIRATLVDDDEPGYPARVLEVYGPQGEPPLAHERSIGAVNDGGRWVFETSGTPFAFEDQEAYRRRLKKSRFTGEMLLTYLRALGVPIDSEPDWRTAVLLERR